MLGCRAIALPSREQMVGEFYTLKLVGHFWEINGTIIVCISVYELPVVFKAFDDIQVSVLRARIAAQQWCVVA